MVGRSTRNYLVNSKFRVEVLDGAKIARKNSVGVLEKALAAERK